MVCLQVRILNTTFFFSMAVFREVGLRVAPCMRLAFMSSPRNYSFVNGSIFVSYHQVKPKLWKLILNNLYHLRSWEVCWTL